MSAPVLAFKNPKPTRIFDELVAELRVLERMAGSEFLKRNYLVPLVRKDVECFRRHRGQRWDLDAQCWMLNGGAR